VLKVLRLRYFFKFNPARVSLRLRAHYSVPYSLSLVLPVPPGLLCIHRHLAKKNCPGRCVTDCRYAACATLPFRTHRIWSTVAFLCRSLRLPRRYFVSLLTFTRVAAVLGRRRRDGRPGRSTSYTGSSRPLQRCRWGAEGRRHSAVYRRNQGVLPSLHGLSPSFQCSAGLTVAWQDVRELYYALDTVGEVASPWPVRRAVTHFTLCSK
jgi:hypothetical protein